MSVQRIGLITHRGRPAAREATGAVHAWCRSHGIRCTDIDVWGEDQQRRTSREEAEAAGDPDLLATPTGSTACGFAAGGPVLSSHIDAVVFTPIAPHMTFDHSVVAAPDEPVALRILPNSGQAAVIVDGRLHGILDPGDWIGVFRAPHRVRLIRLHPTDFYGRPHDRFRLTDAPARVVDGQAAPFFRPDTPIPPDLAEMRLPPRQRRADPCRRPSSAEATSSWTAG